MATKQFQGEVIESRDSSFQDQRGELINNWRIGVMLNEDSQRTFHIGKDNPCRKEAEQIVKGSTVRITAEPVAGQGTAVKWRALQIEQIGVDEKKDIPF